VTYFGNASRRSFFKFAGFSALASATLRRSSSFGQVSAQKNEADNSLVSSVRPLGKQFLDNPLKITGLDGATSTQLPSGEALWLFGDTVEGPFKSIRDLDLSHLCSSTAAIVPQQDCSHGIKKFRFLAQPDGKRPRQPLPFVTGEDPAVHRVWPIHGACVGQETFVFYHRITLLKGVDVFVNFQLDGMGIARAQTGDFEFKRLIAPDGTREFWKGNEPTFGVFVEQTKDYVYLWGSLATGMHLARTRPRSIADLASYEYLVEAPTSNKPNTTLRWATKFSPTATLFNSVPNEMSAAYNPHLRMHVAFHSLHRENKIVMRTAPRITGPWSDPQVVYRPEKITDKDLIYAAKEHPELARENGRVLYVTFVNSADYVPRLIEVTLK
jgi:Domain of unknown function (DUF4185)